MPARPATASASGVQQLGKDPHSVHSVLGLLLAAHLGDVGRQFVSLLPGGGRTITGGEMTFKRYVELGRVFEVALVEHDLKRGEVAMVVNQARYRCAEVRLRYEVLR